jgi:hypothetical protein
MLKKILINLFVMSMLLGVAMSAFAMKQKINSVKLLFEETKKIEILHKNIENKYIYTDPDVKDFIIPNVISVKRTVYLFQHIDGKNRWEPIPQKTINITHDIKVNDDFILTKEQILSKVEYKKLNIKSYPNLIGKGFDGKETTVKYEEEVGDFDNDLDIYVFNKHKIKKDIFKQLNDNTLVNSIELDKPRIGDIKMEYEIFSPNHIILFKNITNDNFYPDKTTFTDKRYEFTDQNFLKATIILVFVLYNNIILIILFVCIKNIKKYARGPVLGCIPFFGEYLIFSSIYGVVFSMTALNMTFIVDGRVFILVVIIFICIVDRDYHSV